MIDRAMSGLENGDPTRQLIALADAYLTFAARHRLRWEALFLHRMPSEAALPTWFLTIQDAAFSHIEAPLSRLRPDLPDPARALLGRNIFARGSRDGGPGLR